jgi:hypothetical protein
MIYLPTSGLAFLRRHVQLSNDIAQKLILSRSSDMDNGKDALSRIGIGVRRRLTCPGLSFSVQSLPISLNLGVGV